MIIHQVFGLLGDNEMPELFKKCQKKVIDFCRRNNYSYRLWDEKSCNRLINKYPKYKDLYYSVKFSIMKVDIIRFVILHYYGGLYLDLDVYPKLEKLKDYDFAVSKINTRYEIEVIQSHPCNHLLLEYLDYIILQIEEKNKIKIYEDWKVRFVLQTTGPLSFCRFMKNKKIDSYKMNTLKWGSDNLNLEGDEDFISHQSVSYMVGKKMRE